MSDQEKKEAITNERANNWWRKIRVFVPIYDAIKVTIIIIGVVWGVGLAIEKRVAEVLANPKRTAKLEQQDSAKFMFVDSSLDKHNGYFSTIFKSIDTSKRKN